MDGSRTAFAGTEQRSAAQNGRETLNDIFYILRTDAPCRDLPARYGPRTTVYNRYVRWDERGVWNGIFDALAEECEDSLVFIDASIIKAHRTVSDSKRGTGGRY
ncbi:transposase [Hyphococcus luteus]|uniref:Insertion element IS402-like domain-containing protein n=1 Tax=Hyphococcus luteus TaxID=2058213 RepID=A0A2S7K505_9PROT|nr:transposase [Marinicaulis flavus]PQA87595.1 hypothetical protein CW354_10975 [Marinicaulis flavus]